MEIIKYIGFTLLILVGSPIIGGLLAGIDRKISARMQRRKGPPILQPFYDVFKLLQKEATTVNFLTRFYVTYSLCFAAVAAVLFFLGMDILLPIFALTLSVVFLIIAAYSSGSPYSLQGAQRELLSIMAYEPMVFIAAFGFYSITHSFHVWSPLGMNSPIVVQLPLILLGFVYILSFKFRKSPFDLSTSHHGHQELVKGATTEMTGICLAMFEVSHWFETVYALGFVFIFFIWNNPWSYVLGVAVCLVVYFLEILIDNSFARVKWQAALKVTWAVSSIVGFVNLYIVQLWK